LDNYTGKISPFAYSPFSPRGQYLFNSAKGKKKHAIFLEDLDDSGDPPVTGSAKATSVANGTVHRPKKIVAKSPSRALTNGGGAPKSKPGARKGSWHTHISPYSRAEEVANGGKNLAGCIAD
jgi:hypothetical protein